MKLIYRLAPLCLSILLIGCAANPVQNSPAQNTPAQSSPARSGGAFAPAGGGFSVDMPGEIHENPSHGGHFYYAEGNDVGYFVAYADFEKLKDLNPAQASEALDRKSGALIKGAGQVLFVKTISVDGHDARRINIARRNGHLVHLLVTLVHGRLFMASAETNAPQMNTAEAAHFLDSFHITMH